VAGKVADHSKRRALLLEAIEEEPYRLLHLLVGVQYDPAGGVVAQPDGQALTQLPLAGLLDLATQQSATQPMQLRLAHRAAKAQEQAIIVLAGVVDPVLVDNEGVGERTDLDKPVPVATGAGEPRGFETQHCPRMAQTHLGPFATSGEPCEAVAVCG
jgi:hypothetical protein